MRGLIVYIPCRSSEGTRASCGSSAGVHILESTRPMCDGVVAAIEAAPRTLHVRTLDVWKVVHAVAGSQWGLSVWNLASEASGRSIDLANRCRLCQDLIRSKSLFALSANPSRSVQYTTLFPNNSFPFV